MGCEIYDKNYQREFGTTPRQSGFAILQDKHFKLVHFNGGVKPLLYDMKYDPYEAWNLANNPDHMADLLTMTQKMLDHRMTHAHHSLSRMSITADGLIAH
jgi:arylsulfatase A-like enzyme